MDHTPYLQTTAPAAVGTWPGGAPGGVEQSMDDRQPTNLDVEQVVIRPMTQADRPGMRDSTRASIQDLRVRLGAQPEPERQHTQGPNSGVALIDHLLQIDAGGAWVAVLDGQVCGAAMA